MVPTIGVFVESELICLSTRSLYPMEAMSRISSHCKQDIDPGSKDTSFMDQVWEDALKIRTLVRDLKKNMLTKEEALTLLPPLKSLPLMLF